MYVHIISWRFLQIPIPVSLKTLITWSLLIFPKALKISRGPLWLTAENDQLSNENWKRKLLVVTGNNIFLILLFNSCQCFSIKNKQIKIRKPSTWIYSGATKCLKFIQSKILGQLPVFSSLGGHVGLDLGVPAGAQLFDCTHVHSSVVQMVSKPWHTFLQELTVLKHGGVVKVCPFFCWKGGSSIKHYICIIRK